MRVVVPVNVDKTTIAKRTGRADFFAVYDGENVTYMQNKHALEDDGHDEHHHHHDGKNHHRDDIENLKGCDIMLVVAAGEHIKEALDEVGIATMRVSKDDGVVASELVKKYLAGELKKQKN